MNKLELNAIVSNAVDAFNGEMNRQKYEDACSAFITRLASDGYTIAPVEATSEMKLAGAVAGFEKAGINPKTALSHEWRTAEEYCAHRWSAMIAAAQKAHRQ